MMYMATTSSAGSSEEGEPLTKNGQEAARRRQQQQEDGKHSAPSKRTVFVILGTLFTAIVVYLCFWPETKTVDVVILEERHNQADYGNGQDSSSLSSAPPEKVPIMYRPVCEFWSPPADEDKEEASSSWLTYQEGTQTSMTQPSQTWSEIPCLSVHVESNAENDGSFLSCLFGRRHGGSSRKKNEAAKNPFILDQYQAPDAVLQVNFSNIVFQDRPPIYGFGGAFTEASALNYQSLSAQGKDAVMELLFGKNGLGYSIGRVHINSCDFSVQSYSFDDLDGDFDLDLFDMGVDHDVSSGMVDMALRATSLFKQAWSNNNQNENDHDKQQERVDGNLILFASPWSPPAWMKNPTWRDVAGADRATNMTYSTLPTCLRDGVGPESPYAASWALYFSKFLTAYANLGLPFWAVTVQNEPEFPAPWEACAFTPETETAFVANHLGPRLRQDHPGVKILAFDHNKDHIITWTSELLNKTLGARNYVDGIAYHWYAGGMDRLLDGALGIGNMHRLQELLIKQKEKHHLVLGSESCHCPTTGYAGGDLNVIWDRAERYAHTVLADLMAGSNGWVEWNLLLDTIGGPNHLGNLCESILLAAPHRAKDTPDNAPVLPNFEKNMPFGERNIGDDRTREELNAYGFPAKYLDVGVVVQPIYYYMGHISRHVRPGSYAVSALVTNSGNANDERIFRPKGSVLAGGGMNNLARDGIEITLWPCEGSTRQKFYWEFDQGRFIVVRGHDWLGRPTKSCVARDIDPEFMGIKLVDCKGPDAGRFNVLPVGEPGGDPRYKIILLNHPVEPSPPCLTIGKIPNNNGANGPLGGAQVVLGNCETDESAKWTIHREFGEASSSFLGSEVCMTTGWPFLQMGAFVAPGGKKTVVLLNEANDSANFVLQSEDKLVMSGSIPPRSIQTYVLK